MLKTLKIRFTPGDEFNDPFEITPSAKFMDTPEYFDRFVTRCADRQASREVAEGKILMEEREERIVDLRVKLSSDFRSNLIGVKAAALGAMRTRFSDYRILCLSRVNPEDPAGLLLWAYYTAGHTGFVVEFDEGHSGSERTIPEPTTCATWAESITAPKGRFSKRAQCGAIAT